MRYIGIILLLALAITSALYIIEYVRGEFGVGNSLLYRLPEDYQGFFYIEKSSNGVSVKKNVSGVYEYVVPSNGVLKVRSITPFKSTHKEVVMYPSGKTIPQNLPMPMDETIRLFNGSISSEAVLTFLIGTQEEYKAYLKNRGTSRHPPETNSRRK